MHIACKTHFDTGYSDRVADVLTFYRTTMIDRALDLIDRSRELPPERTVHLDVPWLGFSTGLLRTGRDRQPNVVHDWIVLVMNIP